MKISIGVIIAIALIVYWYMQDHPRAPPPVTKGQAYEIIVGSA